MRRLREPQQQLLNRTPPAQPGTKKWFEQQGFNMDIQHPELPRRPMIGLLPPMSRPAAARHITFDIPTVDELERNRLEHEMNVENASLELVGANETIAALNRSANEMVANMNQTIRDLTIDRAAVESMRVNALDANELDFSHDWELEEDASNYHEQRHKLWEAA